MCRNIFRTRNRRAPRAVSKVFPAVLLLIPLNLGHVVQAIAEVLGGSSAVEFERASMFPDLDEFVSSVAVCDIDYDKAVRRVLFEKNGAFCLTLNRQPRNGISWAGKITQHVRWRNQVDLE